MERIEKSFSKIQKKYYVKGGFSFFDHLNSDHFSAFLYFFSNTIWREVGDSALPERLFYLNKIMNGIDLYYPVEMPEVFLLVHPLGTVLGRACYGNYLAVYQNCTIGAVTDIYPRFGEGVILYSRSSVLGDCNIGNNVVFGANSLVIDCNVPDNSLVVGQYPNHRCYPIVFQCAIACLTILTSPPTNWDDGTSRMMTTINLYGSSSKNVRI
ncbi:MAG: serine acetyltransferase [Cyanobacteria bacterium J06639_16]